MRYFMSLDGGKLIRTNSQERCNNLLSEGYIEILKETYNILLFMTEMFSYQYHPNGSWNMPGLLELNDVMPLFIDEYVSSKFAGNQ